MKNNAERTRFNTGMTRVAMGAVLLLSLAGCVTRPMPALSNATLTPPTRTTRDLTHLPPPKGKIVAAVYGFRDLTGQYKASPDSSFSSQVTQGGASFLVKAMRDSGWFTPVERENLQDLLTELFVRYPPDPGRGAGIGQAVGEQRTVHHRAFADEVVRAIARDPWHYDALRRLGLGSALVVPLQVVGRTIGVLTLTSEQQHRYTDADVELVEDLARRIEGAKLLIVQAMAHDLAPAALPEVTSGLLDHLAGSAPATGSPISARAVR